MKVLKNSMIAAGLLATFASSAAIAYAAPIEFEKAETSVYFDSDEGKWCSRALTEGSYGTSFSRSYTEIFGDGEKIGYKTSDKETGRSSSAYAFGKHGYKNYVGVSSHRIWWRKSDSGSITTTSKDSF